MTSLKKLIAVLAISLPLAAMAQQAAAPAAPPLAQIYGTLNLNLQRIGTVGSPQTAAGAETNIQSRWAVSADSSNIGVKGTANVAGGFGVVYQCESSAKLDGVGTIAATGNTPTGTTSFVTTAVTICDRNSRLGLTNATYGTLFLGNWDTPFKAAYYGTKADDPFGSTDVFGANNLLGSPGFATKSGGANGFDIRATNSVAYWSPKVSGLALRLQASVDENATNRYHGDPAATQTDPWVFGGALNYDMGPLSAVVAYEQHRDSRSLQSLFGITVANGATAGDVAAASRDEAWRIGAGYEVPLPIGPLTVAATWEQLTYTSRVTSANRLQQYQRRAVRLSGKQRYGDHELRAQYIWADKGTCKFSESTAAGVNDCDHFGAGGNGAVATGNGIQGLGAHQVTLGYAYFLASSTQVFVFYNKIVNSAHAAYVPGAGGSFSGAPAIYLLTPGADPEAYGLGMRYAF
jgi:predicted porin